MDSLLLWTSFLSGVLTVLAPCVLPLLPVIVGGAAGSTNRRAPFIMTASLAVSVVAFTLLLKVSSALINVPQSFWTGFSGGIILLFGIFTAFPSLWENISIRFNLLNSSQRGLAKAGANHTNWSAVLIGAALGPVFSSCSPTYFVILATVLPVSFFSGFIYLVVYALGLALMLGLIAFYGQKLTLHLGWAANPHGLFKKILGWLLIFVGLLILTGTEKSIELKLIDAGFGTTQIEKSLLDDMGKPKEGAEPEGQELSPEVDLPKLYPAPEFQGLSNWINSEPIQSIHDLKGKVVLVDFWTYSCINCIRTLPYIESWHEKYADQGLVIIGIHAPEFQFEKIYQNVADATQKFGLRYPVVQDNDFGTWRAYNNRYWPAKYLIDKDGIVRFTHFGEGDYDETEGNIVALLGAKMESTDVNAVSVDYNQIGTGETYIGSARATNFVGPDKALDDNEWTLEGDWNISGESATSGEANTKIRMRFTASVANLVMGGKGTAEVYIDGKLADASNAGSDVKEGILTLDGQRLYELANFSGQYGTHEIEVIFKESRVELFAWTFG